MTVNDIGARVRVAWKVLVSEELRVDAHLSWTQRVIAPLEEYLDARRAAEAAGYVAVMVSKEAVEALREWDNLTPTALKMAPKRPEAACRLLARDLADAPKEN